MLTLAQQITDAMPPSSIPLTIFRSIPGIMKILRRQGLLEDVVVSTRKEELSPGQIAEMIVVCRAYPHLQDDAFVQEPS